MSKKKKFTGKKTKLAEHALTQVLEQERAASAAEPQEALPSSLTLVQAVQTLRNDQLNLDIPAPNGSPVPIQRQMELARGYLAMLQELEQMRELLRAPTLPARPRSLAQELGSLPNPAIIQYSLQVIGHTLREIRTFLR